MADKFDNGGANLPAKKMWLAALEVKISKTIENRAFSSAGEEASDGNS
jgi:hypothetical protein